MKSKFFFVMSVAATMLLASCNQPNTPATTTQDTASTPAGTSTPAETSVEQAEVVSVECSVESNELEVGKELVLQPVVTVKGGANKRCTFKSSDDKIATVTSTGVVKGVSKGKVTITITSAFDNTKKTEVQLEIVDAKIVLIKDFVVNEEYTVVGKVVALNTRSFLISDGSAAVMIYLNAAPSYEIGDVVEVSGKVIASAYSAGFVQFDNKCTIKKVDQIVGEIPGPVDLTAAIVEAWVATYNAADNKESQFYKQDEMKLYKWTTVAAKDGNYDIIKMPGSDVVIEPVYADGSVYKFTEGKKYDVEGYYAGYRVTSSGSAYAQIVLTKAEEKQAQPGEVFVTADKKAILVDEVATLTATIEQGGDAVVQWSLKEANMGQVVALTVDAENGNKATVKGLEAGEVIVVATNGNFSFETKITVSAIAEVAISNITEAGKVYSATGVVAALTSKGFVLSDGAASIYVFMNDAPTVVVGDMVNVEGGVSAYNKVFQFSAKDSVKPVTVTKVEGNIPNLPVAVDLTGEIVAGWKDAKAVATTDVKLYKWTAKATKPGDYLMTNLEGCEIDIEPSNVPSDITLEVGKTYELEAYFGGFNNKNAYAAMYITKAKEVGGGEQTSEQGSQPAESTEQGQSTEQGSVEVKNHGTVSEPISVAEAKSIIADLADPTSKGNVYDDEMLYVTGVVVKVTYEWKGAGKSMSFTIKDANAIDGDALAAQFIYLAADLTEAPAAGDTVLLRGYAAKYNNGSVVTPQISAPKDAGEDTRATVLSFQKAGGQQTSEEGSQPAESTEQGQSTEQGSVEVKNHGTVSEPISVAEAKSIIADLADPTSKGNVYDDEMLYVTGVVVKVTYEWKGAGKSMSFTIKDANAIDGDALAAQFIYLAADLTEAPAAGDTVLLRGYAAKYNNGSVVTPQISAPKDAGEDTRATVLSFQKAGGQQTSEEGSQPADSSEIVPVESGSQQGAAGIVATMTAGTNGARAKVNGQDAIKVGNKSNGGDLTITVGAGATKVAFYAGAWKGENSTSITLSGATADPAEFTLTACAAFTGTTTNYTVESEATYYIEADLAGIAEETVITLTSASKRFVVWNAVYFTA